MYKKILALCLTAALVISTAIAPIYADNSKSVIRKDDGTDIFSMLFKPDKKDNGKHQDVLKHFTDSDAIDWAQKSIEKLGAMGILSGIGNGQFKPSNNVTNAEAIAMVLKLTGQQEKAEAIKTQPEYFKGLSDSWSWGYLQLALNEGIIIPSEDGRINPKTPAKRHEIAKYIVRAIGKRDDALKNMNARLSFHDANAIPSTSIGYVYVVNNLGIMQGSKNEFQPNKPVTRAEMAVLLDRAADCKDGNITNENAHEGIFVAYDKNNSKITLNVNNTQVVYNVNPYAPVYRNNTYYILDTLKAGDIIEVVLDSSNTVIFVEFKQDGTLPQTGQPVSTQRMQYSDLSQGLKDRVDALKLIENYVAFRQDQYVYLIASRGQMSTGGYSITINNVYREAAQTGRCNIKVFVDRVNPSASAVTQAITYPYDIVRFAYVDGIDKINFVDNANNLLRQTTLSTIDAVEVINGRINSIDATNRIIYLKESDNVVRPYYIPANVQITLDNRTAALSSLSINMNLGITKTNGVITSIAAQTTVDTIQLVTGIINSLDAPNRIVYLKESDNVVRPYYVPANVEITLNNTAAALNALTANMNLTITKTNSVITKLAAQSVDTVETINGRVNSVDGPNRILYVRESDNVIRPYYIPTNVQITLNNASVALTALTDNMTVALTRTNGIITRVAATQTTQTISGKIDSVYVANETIRLLESSNVINSYNIPTTAQITVNGQAASFSSLRAGMTAVITKVDNVITAVAAQNDVQTIEGVLINVYPTTNNASINVKIGDTYRQFIVIPETAVFYNNQSISITQMPLNVTITVRVVNGIVTEVRNK